MSRNPRSFDQVATVRLIVRIEQQTVDAIDKILQKGRYHQHRNRAEFVRRAVEAELERCEKDVSRKQAKAALTSV